MTTLRLKLGEEAVKLISIHNGFAAVAQAALGSPDKDAPAPRVGDPGVKNLAEGHATVEDAVAAINRAMRGG